MVQCAVVLGLIFLGVSTSLPFGMDFGMLALPWIWLGYRIYPFLRDHSWKKLHVFLILAIIFVWMHWFSFPQMNLSMKEFIDPVFALPWVLLMVMGWIAFFQWVPKLFYELFSVCSRASILLFVLHPYTNNIANSVSAVWFHAHWGGTFALSLAILSFPVYVKSRYPQWGVMKYV